jgi:translation elongation factor EF-Tu-like GTPase
MFLIALGIGIVFAIIMIQISTKQVNKNNQSPIEGEYYAPQNNIDKHKPFAITVVDVFNIKNRGIIITGHIESGIVSIGDNVTIRKTS